MKKSFVNTSAFRYIFEILVIVFSVTISFYIQELLNQKDRVDLKNAGLIGVLSDFEEDLNIFNSMSKSLDKRTKNIESILNDDLISNKVFNELMRYFGFVGNDTNYKSMISTALSSISKINVYSNNSTDIIHGITLF